MCPFQFMKSQTHQPKQRLITSSNSQTLQETFNQDPSIVFVGCNIPLHKLEINVLYQNVFTRTVEQKKVTLRTLRNFIHVSYISTVENFIALEWYAPKF